MESARLVVQAQGYSALSFRELAKDVGVKSASVHYHFPTKGDLGAALAREYALEANRLLSALSLAPADIDETMKHYANAFRGALANDNRMCLCGIMIAERDNLPDIVRDEVDNFSNINIDWLRQLLKNQHPRRADTEIRKHALAIFSAVEGAQLIARGRNDISAFDDSIEIYRSSGLFPHS